MRTIIEGINLCSIRESAKAFLPTQTIRAYIKRGRIKSQRMYDFLMI